MNDELEVLQYKDSMRNPRSGYWVMMMTFEFEITRGNRVPLILKNASE